MNKLADIEGDNIFIFMIDNELGYHFYYEQEIIMISKLFFYLTINYLMRDDNVIETLKQLKRN